MDVDVSVRALVSDLLLTNAQQREAIELSLLDGKQREIEYWQARALKAEKTLWLAQERMLSIFADDENEVYGD